MTTPHLRPESPELAEARRLLKRRASEPPTLGGLATINASAAFWVLEGLRPPLPPVGDIELLRLPAEVDVRVALQAAAKVAGSVEEAAAIATAARELADEG